MKDVSRRFTRLSLRTEARLIIQLYSYSVHSNYGFSSVSCFLNGMFTAIAGYKEIKIDHEKELVTVTGSMDIKELVETLKKQLKKDVQIVPPKKEGGEKKEGGGGGRGKENDKGKENEKGKDGEGGGDKKDVYEYQDMDATAIQAIQLFSDENANACTIM